jgi:hypothetical protein
LPSESRDRLSTPSSARWKICGRFATPGFPSAIIGLLTGSLAILSEARDNREFSEASREKIWSIRDFCPRGDREY